VGESLVWAPPDAFDLIPGTALPRRRSAIGAACSNPTKVRYGSWPWENEIRFGRNAERKTNFCVFFAPRMTVDPEIPGCGYTA
jgi:hypothetical protein